MKKAKSIVKRMSDFDIIEALKQVRKQRYSEAITICYFDKKDHLGEEMYRLDMTFGPPAQHSFALYENELRDLHVAVGATLRCIKERKTREKETKNARAGQPTRRARAGVGRGP